MLDYVRILARLVVCLNDCAGVHRGRGLNLASAEALLMGEIGGYFKYRNNIFPK